MARKEESVKHKITTHITDKTWVQELTCTFPNEAIATLVLEGTNTSSNWGSPCLLTGSIDSKAAAQIRLGGRGVEVGCDETCCWDSDHEANKQHLEALAQAWKAESDKWLQIHRYYSVAVEPILRELADNVARLERHINTLEMAIHDVAECLDMDESRMGRIEAALQGHSSQVLAHFPVVGNLRGGKENERQEDT